ncbi:hypothetical protein QVD17_30581 [Tagetes erecta]|uniref:Uncharacterized protein n=1 Tax=Tagetes erecta TaxID=13708 RepID=A0AAD8K5W5_TARER|nr:hypothetical protein QVD17_30581 [Tagetes erecta]
MGALAKDQPYIPPDRRIALKFKEVKKALKEWVKASKHHDDMEAYNLRSTIASIELAAESRVLSDLENQVRIDGMHRLRELDFQKRQDLKKADVNGPWMEMKNPNSFMAL